MMKEKIGTIVVLLLLVFSLGCMGQNGGDEEGNIVITDARGEEITFNSTPERIVSWMPSNTEILFYLGLGDRVVGTDASSDYPEEAKNKRDVGGALSGPEYEKIASLSPDVVVTSDLDMIDSLKNYDIKAVMTGTTTLEDVYSDMKMLGKMCGIEEEAEDKAQDLRSQMDTITEDTGDLTSSERVDTLYITSARQQIWTTGKDTFQHTLLRNAGSNNIASDKTGWFAIEESVIIDSKPEVIIGVNSTRDSVNSLANKTAWKDIPAVKNGDIYFVGDDIISRPAPRVVQAQQRLVDITTSVMNET